MICTSCFTGGGQSGTEADDLGGHDAAVDGGASTTSAVTSANGRSAIGETNRESTSPDASVSGATEGETITRHETADDTSSSERGITVPSPLNTSGGRGTSDGPVTTDDHTTADGHATSDVATGSSNDDGAASSTDADPHATDSDTEAYFFTAPFDPQRQIADLTPPRAPVDHPAGDCVVVNVDTVDAECSAHEVCEGNAFWVSCRADDFGATCTLMDKFSQVSLRSPNLTPGMCETLLEGYKAGNISHGEPTCEEPVLTSYGYDICAMEHVCAHEMTVGGLVLSDDTSRTVRCFSLDAGGYDCTCESASLALYSTYTSYHLEQSQPTAACNQAFDLCTTKQDPTPFVDAPSCAISSEVRAKDNCHVTSECSYEHSFGDGATQTAKAVQSVQCENVSLRGAWSCNCSGADSIGVEIPDASLDSRVCGQIDEPCRSVSAATVFSDALCVPTVWSNFGGDCSATFDCRRDFDLNGIDAVINAPLFIDCTLEEPSLGWQCDCDGAEYAVFTVQADDAAGACAAAAAPCQQYQRQFAQEALAR